MAYTNYNWITDCLAIGAFVAQPDGDFPFDAVMSLETWAPPTVRELIQSGSVDYRWFSIIDGYSFENHEEIVKRFDAAVDQIHAWHAQDKRILIHCTAGVSRSVTTVIWYLMRYENFTWEDAYALVRQKRSIAFPNPRFEIPLRVHAGETIDWNAFERRMEAHCINMRSFDVEDTRESVLEDLERQGTLQLLRQRAS
jgi:hypothetical protein